MPLSRAWQSFLDAFVRYEGSTRLAALIRIGMVLQAWSRWGYTFQLHRNLEPDRLVLAVGFWVSTTLLLVGWHTRVMAVLSALAATLSYLYLGVVLGNDMLAKHHTRILVMGMWFVACLPAGRSWSVDRYLAVRRAWAEGREPPAEQGPLWGQRLMMVQVSVLYAATAWEKSYYGFLSGDRMEQIYLAVYFGSEGLDSPWFGWFCLVSAWAVTLLDWVLVVGLWVPRLKWVLLAIAVVVHAVIYAQLPVATFTATMYVFYLAFVDPQAFHRAVERIT